MSDEGDSTLRSKRIKKGDQEVIVISDSDSDENVGVARTPRKKTKTILSAHDGSESSGSSVVFVDKRRRVSSFSSDSSEDNSDKCSICLRRFTSQKVGTPKSCEHIFCLDCILEWSKNVNTCPVDRKLFKSIVVRACAGGRVLRTQRVRAVKSLPFVVDDSDLPYCEVSDYKPGWQVNSSSHQIHRDYLERKSIKVKLLAIRKTSQVHDITLYYYT